jgi:small subunit ribosomal protein S18
MVQEENDKPLNRKSKIPSYKEPKELAKYMDDRGKILNREKSRLTAKQQRTITTEIKRARFLGLLPYTQTLK